MHTANGPDDGDVVMFRGVINIGDIKNERGEAQIHKVNKYVFVG